MGPVTSTQNLREGTINKAFCFETDSIDGPFLALEKRAGMGGRGAHLHYFCASEGCAYPLKGAALKRREEYDIAYFVSKPRGPDTPRDHEADCPFVMGERSPKGHGESQPPSYHPFTAPSLFIPELLVDDTRALVRPWLDGEVPPKAALLAMITSAEARPVHGSIEDVMSADRAMAKAYRDYKRPENPAPSPSHKRWEKRLIIGDNDTTYQKGIVYYPDAAEHLKDKDFWQNHIVWFTGRPRRDPEMPGAYYLRFGKADFWIWVDGNRAAEMKTKAYIPELFERQITDGGSIHCHLWGAAPLVSKKGSVYLRLKDINTLLRAGFMAVL